MTTGILYGSWAGRYPTTEITDSKTSMLEDFVAGKRISKIAETYDVSIVFAEELIRQELALHCTLVKSLRKVLPK